LDWLVSLNSSATSLEEKQLQGAFLEELDAEPKLPWIPRSVTEFVPSIVPLKPPKANSPAHGSINQLLQRTPPQRKPKAESPLGSPIDFDDDIQIAASVEVIDFGKSSRKRKVQFALPCDDDTKSVPNVTPFSAVEVDTEKRFVYQENVMQS
jgi:hypothetical protein